MRDVQLSVPFEFRRGALRKDERASVDSALKLLDLIDRHHPLAEARMLDFGCGVKLVQGLVERGNPQSLYAGVDVYLEMIEFLQSRLGDNPKYHFAGLNFQNDMYNKTGEKMTPQSDLPIPAGAYDIATMFSVITHMVPEDSLAVFSILRRYIHPRGTLVFSAFAHDDQEVDFFDQNPKKPLLHARYNKDFLVSLLARAGWDLASEHPGIPNLIAKHFVCRPAV